MVMPKDIARSYPRRGLATDLDFRSEPKFCGDGSFEAPGYPTSGPQLNYAMNHTFSAFTCASWVYIDGDSLYNIYMAAGDNAVGGHVAFGWINGTTNPQLRLYDRKGGGTSYIPTQLFPEVRKQWCHVAFTLNSAGDTIKMYVNGVPVTGVPQPTAGNEIEMPASDGSTIAAFNVGSFQHSSSGSTLGIGGNLANFGLYDAELTQDQICQLMRASDYESCSAVATPQVFFELFDSWAESTGNIGTTQEVQTPTFTQKRPQLPRGLDLTGGFKSPPLTFDGDCVKLDGSTQGATSATTYSIVTSGAKTTIAGWALPRSLTGGNQTLFGNAVNGGSDNFAIYQTGTNELAAIAIYAGGATSVRAAAKNLDKDRWYFLAATFDYDTTTLKFYVDGVEFSETPFLGYGGTGGLFEIGFRDDPGGDIQFFDGNLAHVMMIEDVLTQGEIVELMRDTTYAKAQTFGTVNRYYELDADFNDDTGSHNATSIGSPTFINVKANPTRMTDPSRGSSYARMYSGRCVDFDGSTDFLDMGTGVDKNYTTRSDRASFSVWFNTDQTAAAGFLYQNRYQVGATDRPECETQLMLHPTLGLAFDGEGASVSAPLANIKIGQWHHFVGIADDTDGPVKVYLDGVLYDTTSAALAGANGTSFCIGARNNAPIQVFNGQLSNFKIFNVELTQAQVRELYHNPEMVIPTGVSASNLRRHYPLCAYNDTGGMGGRYETDQGVEGVNGEYGGSPVMNFAQSVPCPQLGLQQSATRLRFPGGNTTHNAVATTAALGTTASVSCWFQVENTGVTRVLWAIGNATGTGFLEAYVNSGDVLQVYGQSAFTVATITDSDWHHLVVTTDSGSPPYRVFLDNSEVSLSGSDTARNLTNGTFEIGNQDTAASPFVFQGILNDVACWNTELGDSDVAALYNAGVMGMDVSTVQSANLKGWWKCDDLTTLKDYSGNGANATVTNTFNAASFPENASGSTIVGDFSLKRKGVSVLNPAFDPIATSSVVGVSAEIPGCDAISFDPTKGMSFTLAFRLQSFKPTPTSVWYPRIFAANAAGADYYLRFNYTHEILNFVLRDSASTVQSYNYTTGTVSDLDWHHIAITVDTSTSPNTTVKLWFDGALINTFASANHDYAFTPDELRIGTYNYGNGNFPGAIANFRIYQAALSQGEVEQSYSSDMRLIKGLANE